LKAIIFKYPVLILAFIAFVIRLTYMWWQFSTVGLITISDAEDYMQFARFMVEQGLMVRDISELRAHAGPGYPLIIAVDVLLFNLDHLYFTLFIGLLSSVFAVVLIYKLSLLIFNNQTAALIAGFWATLYIHYIRYTPLIGKENIVICLWILVTYLLILNSKIQSVKYIILMSFAYLYLIHVDERYLFFLPLLLWFLSRSATGFKRITIFIGLIGLGMLPWLYRNYVVFQRPVILTERTAPFTDKIFGYTTPVNPIRLKRPKDTYNKANLTLYENFVDSLKLLQNPTGSGLKSAKGIRDAFDEGQIPHTYNFLEKQFYELVELLTPVKFQGTFVGYGYRYMPAWKPISNLLYGLQYGLILIVFPFAFWMSTSKNQNRYVNNLLLMILVGQIILHLFFGHALQRYRVPIDFVLIIYGGLFLDYGFKKLLNRYGSEKL
jgi:hypothetical protein